MCIKHLVPFLLMFALVGCDSSSAPPTLDGDFEIETLGGGSEYTFSMSLGEEDGDVSGSGTLTIEDQTSTQARTLDLIVTGTHDHPDLELTISTSEGDKSRFDGTLEDDAERASGTLTFPNGRQQQVTLR